MDCLSLWIGDQLGAVERACLRSVMRQGHRVFLYVYSALERVPEGVVLRSAEDILPRRQIFLHRNGSVAPFSDWFRYELQRRALGTWVDTDIYLVAPLDQEGAYLFGEEQPGVLNNAILRLPADSPMLPSLLHAFAGRTPRWLKGRAHLQSRLREVVTGKATVASMPWGTTGPAGLTAAAMAFRLYEHALPKEVFYPVAWQDADWLVDPSRKLENLTTSASVAVHLWNDRIKTFKNRPAPRGSFLERLQHEGQ